MERPQRLPSSPAKTYDLGFKNGAGHGFDELQKSLMDWLQAKYITDPNRPDRGSPQGEALLQLAREAQMHISELKLKRIS